MEDGVDVTRRNLIEFTDTEQAHEDENEDTEVMGPPKKTSQLSIKLTESLDPFWIPPLPPELLRRVLLSKMWASIKTKTGRHDIAEILLKVAINTINQIKSCTIQHISLVLVR
jgi:hypothetical protein